MTSTPPERSASFTNASVPEQYDKLLAPVIFEPWAELLLDRASIRPGDRVLDVACGTGVVARAAARRAGETGAVLATDISPPMLATSAAHSVADGAAPIEYLEASADQLPLDSGSFDVVLCQQGLQFFGDKAAAVAEMIRVLRPGGRLATAVWADGHALEPFDIYGLALQRLGVEEPFQGAFEPSSFALSESALRTLLVEAGCEHVEVETCRHTAVWPDAEAAAGAIMGTPFAPLLTGLSPEQRTALDSELREHFAPEPPGLEVRRVMVSLLAFATVAGETGTTT